MTLTVDVERHEVARSWLAQAVEALLMQWSTSETREEFTVSLREDGELLAHRTFPSKRTAARLEHQIAADLPLGDLRSIIIRHKLQFVGVGNRDQ